MLMRFRTACVVLLVALIAGCSSPPPPTAACVDATRELEATEALRLALNRFSLSVLTDFHLGQTMTAPEFVDLMLLEIYEIEDVGARSRIVPVIREYQDGVIEASGPFPPRVSTLDHIDNILDPWEYQVDTYERDAKRLVRELCD